MEKIEIAYLNIASNLLVDMSEQEFVEFAHTDAYGNQTSNIQHKEDLRRELEKIERYDLLKLL